MNERELRVQPESAPGASDEPDTFAALLTERDRRDGTTSFERHRVGIGEFNHVRAEPVRTFRCWRRANTKTR
jgi:hypothetical protein